MAPAVGYDRAAELKAFDDTKAGVKGLVDSGITSVPRIFHVPPDDPIHAIPTAPAGAFEVPVVDLRREAPMVVEGVRRAAAEWGFFQVVGHGVPLDVVEAMIDGVRRFHADGAAKAAVQSRDPLRKVKYNSNFDLYQSRAAGWRDTLFCNMAPDPPAPEEIPLGYREIIVEYSKQMLKLGETLFELLSQALGLRPTYLKEMECLKGHILLSHCYPPCPQPELALGTARHSDYGFLSVVLQDQLGGLQVLHDGHWVDVSPLPGAFVINIGDFLQLISNDKFTSVEHRVLANKEGPRISIATFFTLHLNSSSTITYGPINELLSKENPPLYRETTSKDYLMHWFSKGIGQKGPLLDFRL